LLNTYENNKRNNEACRRMSSITAIRFAYSGNQGGLWRLSRASLAMVKSRGFEPTSHVVDRNNEDTSAFNEHHVRDPFFIGCSVERSHGWRAVRLIPAMQPPAKRHWKAHILLTLRIWDVGW